MREPGRAGQAGRAGLRTRLVVVGVLLALAVVPAYAVLCSRVWAATGERQAATATERAGLAYLRPLVQLVAATAELQSTQVRGEPADLVRLRAALSAVDRVDGEVGGRLGTREQWADLEGQVQALVTLPRTGPPAVTAVAPVLDLELAHVATVRDGALLALDPELDSTHLLDAVAVSIPGVLVDAARVSDLRALGGARGRTPSLQVAVAQAGLSARAATLDASLRRGLSATSSTDLAPAVIAQLDVLRVAVNAMAPPVAEVGAAPVVPAADQLRAAQTQVRDAALEVASSSLDQLDDLLRERAAGIERERRLVVLVTVAAVLLLALAAWLGTGGGHRHRPDDAEDESGDGWGDDDQPAAAVDHDDEVRLLADVHEPQEPPPGRALARVGRAVAPPRDGR